jgi:hypothetical protein
MLEKAIWLKFTTRSWLQQGLVVAAGQGTQVMMLIVLCSSGNLKLKYKSWAMKMCIGAEE